MISARLTYRLRLAGAITLAIVTVVTAGTLALALSFPTSDWARNLPLTAVTEARAVAAATASPPDLATARRETLRTLALRPGDPAAWCRLAWISEREGQRSDMLGYLDRSYTVAPFGPDVTAWRLRFAYGNWQVLTPDLRRLANSELAVATRDRPALVEAVEPEIVDPAGRLAFLLTKRSATPKPIA